MLPSHLGEFLVRRNRARELNHVTDFNDRPPQSGQEAASELDGLQRIRDELWTALRSEENPERRMTLLSQLSDNRIAILRAVEQMGGSAEDLEGEVPPVFTTSQDMPRAETSNGVDTNPQGAMSGVPPAPPTPTAPTAPAASQDPLDRVQDQISRQSAYQERREAPTEQLRETRSEPLQGYAPPSQAPQGAPPAMGNPPAGNYQDYGARQSSGGYGGPPGNQSPNMGATNTGSVHPGPPGATRRAPGVYAPGDGQGQAMGPGADWVRAEAEPQRSEPVRRGLLVGGLSTLGAVLLVALLVFTSTWPFDGDGTTSGDAAGPTVGQGADVDKINLSFASQGLALTAELRDSALFLVGTVDSAVTLENAVALASVNAGETPIITTNVVIGAPVVESTPTSVSEASQPDRSRGELYQKDLNRILASTPLIFSVGQSRLDELQKQVLARVATVMGAYGQYQVKIIGSTDDVGGVDSNRQLSLTRAENVRAYLVTQGIPENLLLVEARGEEGSTGSEDLAGFERRVEFEVVDAGGFDGETLRVALVAPSGPEDRAFTQSMVDSINAIKAERGGNLDFALTHSTFVAEDAAAQVLTYANEGYDLVIAHGSEYGAELVKIAAEHPEVAFAWGTGTDTFGMDNIYAYTPLAEEGGYVMGAMSSMLTKSDTIGVVGPIEVGDAARYVNGYVAGARAEKSGVDVKVVYTNSFGDTELAATVANEHMDAGADVMSGSAEMVVGAINAAKARGGVLWFGTQANQTSLAPELVVASQVYHWEVLLRQIIKDREAGLPGRSYLANLANGGLKIEFNPDYPLPADVRARADQLIADIASGALPITVAG